MPSHENHMTYTSQNSDDEGHNSDTHYYRDHDNPVLDAFDLHLQDCWG